MHTAGRAILIAPVAAREPDVRADGDDRNRQDRGEARRQQILDAAVELFAASGYRGSGVAELAERVGLTTTGLMYYFRTKERLLREVVAERDRVDLAGVPDELTLADMRDIGAHNAGTPALTRLFNVLAAENLDADDPLHDFFVERYETVRELWRSLLREGQARGDVRTDIDVDQLAREVLATLLGLELQWLMDADRVDLAAATAAYVEGLLERIAPPSRKT